MIASVAAFSGFQPGLLEFLAGLRANNSREWFQAHRAEYETSLLEPARQFVCAMGELFPRLAPDIHAEPKIHGSIFAINRDTRFSADKTPYKTHLDMWFWQGDGPSRERPGYFFRLTPEQLILGAGMHSFSGDGMLERYRTAVLDQARGSRLQEAAEQVGEDSLRGRTYKRVPANLPSDHPRADWLRHSGLYAETEQEVPRELFQPSGPDWSLQQFQRFQPLQQSLVDLLCD